MAGTPHAFRHLKASTLLDRGASLSEVQDILGHSSPETTKAIYAHYAPKFLRAAVEKYSATPTELVAELEAENRATARRHGINRTSVLVRRTCGRASDRPGHSGR